jgi:hypothetical protein
MDAQIQVRYLTNYLTTTTVFNEGQSCRHAVNDEVWSLLFYNNFTCHSTLHGQTMEWRQVGDGAIQVENNLLTLLSFFKSS